MSKAGEWKGRQQEKRGDRRKRGLCRADSWKGLDLQLEEFAHALDLRAADGNFGLLFVAHFEHKAGLEPRHHFLDVMDVHQEGAMRTPEGIGLERGA